MPIFYDPDETGKLNFSHLWETIVPEEVAGLEAETGADFILSPLDEDLFFGKSPACEYALSLKAEGLGYTQIVKQMQAEGHQVSPEQVENFLYGEQKGNLEAHLGAGALLVQYKRGLDLPASVGVRMNSSLYRMCALVDNYWQRVLLTSGVFTCTEAWETRIEGRAVVAGSGDKWPAVQAALDYWAYSGGRVCNIAHAGLLGAWCNIQLSCLKYRENPIKEFYPNQPDFNTIDLTEGLPENAPSGERLRILQRVDDFRITLATLPGIGEKLANQLWLAYNGDPYLLVRTLTDPHETSPIPGLAKGKMAQIRRWFKAPENAGLVPLTYNGTGYTLPGEEADG